MTEWEETRKEIPLALAALVGITVLAAIGGFFISLPHTGDWLVEWTRYTLWLMVGLPVVGYIIGAAIRDFLQDDPWPDLVSMATWIFWAFSVASLVGFLITLPHTGHDWMTHWFLTSAVAVFVIVMLVLTGLANDEQNSSLHH